MIRKSAWTLGRGYGLLGFQALCWSPNEPPAPPAEPPTPPAGGNIPPQRQANYLEFPTKESFQERLATAARAEIRETYGMSEAELKKRLERAKELEAAEEARVKAQQTTEERLKSEKEAAEAATLKAQAEAAEARRQADVTAMCARNGFKNLDYAIFEATKSGKSGPELEAHFLEMAKDDSKKAALGLVVPPPEVVPVPGSTAPGGPPNGNNPPAPPAPGGPPPGGPNVMKMSSGEFAAHLQRLG